jgi:hypothetical protein
VRVVQTIGFFRLSNPDAHISTGAELVGPIKLFETALRNYPGRIDFHVHRVAAGIKIVVLADTIRRSTMDAGIYTFR